MFGDQLPTSHRQLNAEKLSLEQCVVLPWHETQNTSEDANRSWHLSPREHRLRLNSGLWCLSDLDPIPVAITPQLGNSEKVISLFQAQCPRQKTLLCAICCPQGDERERTKCTAWGKDKHPSSDDMLSVSATREQGTMVTPPGSGKTPQRATLQLV